MNHRLGVRLYCCETAIYAVRIYINSILYYINFSSQLQLHGCEFCGLGSTDVVKPRTVLQKLIIVCGLALPVMKLMQYRMLTYST